MAAYEGRASVRSWLYRIATNRCLNARRSAGRRRARGWDMPAVEPPEATRLGEVTWLEPWPDAMAVGTAALDPEADYERSETVSLAFVTALQVLPARQVAVLLLCDVLGFPVAEVAGMLGTSADAVASSLKRARGNLRRNRPLSGEPPPPTGSAAERSLLAAFVWAYESGDVDGLVALLSEGVAVSMPPIPLEYVGRQAAARLFGAIFASGRRVDLVPTRANGQPAYAAYLRAATGIRHGSGLFVLTLSGERISAFTRFDAGVLPWFGLPASLP